MNYQHQSIESTRDPLPLVLPLPFPQPRRALIDGLPINEAAIGLFNDELQALDTGAPTVNRDQVASLVRWLQTLPAETAVATINLRLARVETLRRMLLDPSWDVSDGFARRTRHLLDYIARLDDLIPDDLPLIGHLDDALLVELSWAQFIDEVQDYRDFCRFREANTPRGDAGEQRTAWESECLAIANEFLHRQAVRARGYARPAPMQSVFRVR
jgi:hypothetical protein